MTIIRTCTFNPISIFNLYIKRRDSLSTRPLKIVIPPDLAIFDNIIDERNDDGPNLYCEQFLKHYMCFAFVWTLWILYPHLDPERSLLVTECVFLMFRVERLLPRRAEVRGKVLLYLLNGGRVPRRRHWIRIRSGETRYTHPRDESNELCRVQGGVSIKTRVAFIARE